MDWHSKPYANVMTNWGLAEAYKENAEHIGVEFCKVYMFFCQYTYDTVHIEVYINMI